MIKRLLLSALVLLSTSTCVPGASAQDAMWKTFFEDGTKAYLSGNFVEAEKLLSAALKSAPESVEPNDARQMMIIESLAFVYMQQNKFVEAEAAYKKELALCEKAFGAESLTVVNTLSNMAGAYAKQRKWTESEALFKRALAMSQKNAGADSVAANVMFSLASMYGDQEKYADAEAMFVKAQAIYEKKIGPADIKVLQILVRRGMLDVEQLKYAEAEKLLKQALAISEKNLGPEDAQMGMILDSLSVLYLNQGKYAEAQPLAKRALAINEKQHGIDSIFSLVSLNSLAAVDIGLGRLAEGEALNKRVVALVEKTFGPQHPSAIGSIKWLARVALMQKKDAQAQLLLEKALKIQQKSTDTNPASIAATMNQLAAVYHDQGNYIDAEAMYRTLLEKDKERLGDSDPAVAADLDNLARVLTAMGKNGEAAKLSRQALTIKKALPGAQKLMTQPAAAPPTQTKIQPTADANRPVKDKWALVVGISDFQDPSLNLQYAAKDATDFSNYLINEAHFQPDHVKLLTNEQATRDNIVGALGDKWLGRLANRDDLVVVYVSSHGSSPSSEAKDTNFIVAHETTFDNLILTGIPMQWLTAGIQKMVHCDRTVLVLDVCHAGAAKVATEKGITRSDVAFNPDRVVLGKGQMLVASSDADQSSYESKNYKNGVFTFRLLEGLRRKGDKTPLIDAATYMREKVEEEVLRDRAKLQTPVVVNNWEGADVILGVVPSSPRAGLPATKEASARSTP